MVVVVLMPMASEAARRSCGLVPLQKPAGSVRVCCVCVFFFFLYVQVCVCILLAVDVVVGGVVWRMACCVFVVVITCAVLLLLSLL